MVNIFPKGNIYYYKRGQTSFETCVSLSCANVTQKRRIYGAMLSQFALFDTPCHLGLLHKVYF